MPSEPPKSADRAMRGVAGVELGKLGPVYAGVATAAVVCLGTWLTGRRLRAFNLTGDE